MVGTDRSQTADQAVRGAAECATRSRAQLFVGQVVLPHHPATSESAQVESTRAAAENPELSAWVRLRAGAHAFAVADEDSALAIAHVTLTL